MSVPEQKSQIKIEQQPYDDSMNVKHLKPREAAREKEGERKRGIIGCEGYTEKQTGDKVTKGKGWRL